MEGAGTVHHGAEIAGTLRVARGDGRPVRIEVDGTALEAREGDTVAAALLAEGRSILRHTLHGKAPRGLFCGMGFCFDCLVTVDGVRSVRACVTPVREGMKVETG
ncbi:MAG: (2Fe-2S)-binding protein [Armatimonadetes bacterium]|nr:(2Fe-2S)-binding protein [Armatimonadota bacterium]